MPSSAEARPAGGVPTRRVAAFYAIACAASWACWIPAALAPGGSRPLLLAGSFGPLAAAAIALAPRGQQAERARWWRRLTSLRGLLSPAGTLCVLVPVLVAGLARDSWRLAGGIDLPGAGVGEWLALLVTTVLLGALPEELAWRGYALPLLVRGRDPVAPTLLLGLAWGLWQLPLFFVPGAWQAGIGLGSALGLLYFVNLLAQSLLLTALYLATRCTWAAVLFHGLTALMGEVWQLPVAAEVHRWMWTALLAGVVLLARPPFGVHVAARDRPQRR